MDAGAGVGAVHPDDVDASPPPPPLAHAHATARDSSAGTPRTSARRTRWETQAGRQQCLFDAARPRAPWADRPAVTTRCAQLVPRPSSPPPEATTGARSQAACAWASERADARTARHPGVTAQLLSVAPGAVCAGRPIQVFVKTTAGDTVTLLLPGGGAHTTVEQLEEALRARITLADVDARMVRTLQPR